MNSVTVTTLGNGLRVATDRMDQVETVSLGIWVGAGTRDEKPEVNGVAHLLEHMAFKGTQSRSARDIAEEIEAVGGHLNAYTSRESTAYYAKVLAEHAPLAVDLLSDILRHSTFEEDELARERDVVLQEIGQVYDTPDDLVFDQFQETAFPDQPMGRPVLGTAELIQAMPRQALVDHMGRTYGAERIVLCAAGRIEHERLVELGARLLGDLRPESETDATASRYDGGEFRDDRHLEQAHLVFGLPGYANAEPDYFAVNLFSTMLGGGMSSRLFQEVREKRGLVYSVYSFHSPYRDGGLFGIYAGTGPGRLDELVAVIGDQLGDLGATASDQEIERAKTQMKASLLMARESTGPRAEGLANQLLIYGRPIPVEEVVAKVEAVDRAALARVASHLAGGPLTVAALGPVRGLPEHGKIVERLSS
jgi:predicted Zn-dependent peptidase